VSSDAAADLGLPVQASVTVNLVFQGGRRQAMTNDSRTVYNDTLLNPRSIIRLMRFSNNLPYLVGTGMAGNGSLVVSFTHVNVSGSALLNVVLAQSASLGSSPLPMFAGSDSVSDTTLNLIGETGVFQQVYLRFVVMLSDGTSQSASTHVSTAYEVRSVGTEQHHDKHCCFGWKRGEQEERGWRRTG